MTDARRAEAVRLEEDKPGASLQAMLPIASVLAANRGMSSLCLTRTDTTLLVADALGHPDR